MATTSPASTRRLLIHDEVVELGDVATTGDLWAACALPGDGPEFRFTSTHPGRLMRVLAALGLSKGGRRC
ncbi:MAG: hypothetical protein GEU96_15280 [Propionibacteriales bacterium]|nr:hypothetical protein [Propionibacteriales bacterium]